MKRQEVSYASNEGELQVKPGNESYSDDDLVSLFLLHSVL